MNIHKFWKLFSVPSFSIQHNQISLKSDFIKFRLIYGSSSSGYWTSNFFEIWHHQTSFDIRFLLIRVVGRPLRKDHLRPLLPRLAARQESRELVEPQPPKVASLVTPSGKSATRKVKSSLLGGSRPPDPPAFLGGLRPPRPPGPGASGANRGPQNGGMI